MTNFKHAAITQQELTAAGSPYSPLLSPDAFTGQRMFVVPFSVGDYADGDTSELIRISSSARIMEFWVMNPANTGATSVNCGLGRPVVGGAPTILSAACIFDSLNLTTVRQVWGPRLGFGTTAVKPVVDPNAAAGFGSPAWLMAGLTSDPGGQLSIVFTWTVATTAAGPFINAILLGLAGEN